MLNQRRWGKSKETRTQKPDPRSQKQINTKQKSALQETKNKHNSKNSPAPTAKRSFRVSPKRTCQVHVFGTEQEVKLWNQKAAELNLSFSDYVRECLDNHTLRTITAKTEDPHLQTELSQMREALHALEMKFNLELPQLLNQIAAESPDNRSVEKKIQEHLHGRSLFLNQLAQYCNEKPQLVLEALCKMRQNDLVKQDIQMRWSLK